jgi:hypothetical protein
MSFSVNNNLHLVAFRENCDRKYIAWFIIHILGYTNMAAVWAFDEGRSDSGIHCGNLVGWMSWTLVGGNFL